MIANATPKPNIFIEVTPLRTKEANTMSGGEQQMLAIGRGLMGMPKLLMVDEPFLGLAPLVIEDLKLIFKKIAERGIAILFVYIFHLFLKQHYESILFLKSIQCLEEQAQLIMQLQNIINICVFYTTQLYI